MTNNKKLNINELIFKLIMLFPIAGVLERVVFLSNINKILIALTILLLGLKTISQNIKRRDILILISMIIVYFGAFINTTKALDNFNDIFYLGIWILFFIWIKANFSEVKEMINRQEDYIYKIIVIWNVIVFISLFFKSSYYNTWGGNDGYFKSFSGGEHRLAATCIFIIALDWIIVQKRKDKKYLLWVVIPFISIYLSGARTYLVIVLIFAICIYKQLCQSSRKFYLTVIPLMALMVLAISFTPMWSKFEVTFQEGYWGWMGTITSGRSVFWAADIEAYKDLDIVRKIVGNGYNFIYDVNAKATGTRIWAHNDFINILLTNGMLGVLCYLYVFISFSESILKKYNVKGFVKFGYYMIWLFNAMFNMVYTYICATLALPFILYSFTEINEKGKVIKEKSDRNENICGNT